ncbi:DUF433 domain-containing protein [Alkalicaulis satelles]|uniref:DUF433 domain-containing protein n=1 Tax=Alkalicaulis satelles TaxID=2609175 RepID=A0A5M6ZLM7_9PROT|nr:DUF433 domain-containing protein [Alkalicaulis satelles]KAA5804644.1 DUF433 domain-containing protein [Alkalicaulis satelles]
MAPASNLTLREAAVLAGVPGGDVAKAIEHKVIRPAQGAARMKGGQTRYVSAHDVAYFAAIRRAGLADLPVRHKKRIASRLRAMGPVLAPVEVAEGLILDVDRLAAASYVAALNYARLRDDWIISDPDILGGLPVIRGTRLSVYALAGRLSDGETLDELTGDYPDIPREAFEAAQIFARTHPRRGPRARRAPGAR